MTTKQNWFKKMKNQEHFKWIFWSWLAAFSVWSTYDLFTYGTITLTSIGFFGGAALLFLAANYLFRNNV